MMTLRHTHTSRRVRFSALVLLAVSAVVFYASCTKEPPPPTNRPTPVASNTPVPKPSETWPEMHDVEPQEFTTEEAAREYIAAQIKRVISIRDGHDDPIIITDGSLHIKTSATPDPHSTSLKAEYELSEHDTTLSRIGADHQAVFVAVLLHTNKNSDGPTQVWPYEIPDGNHCSVNIQYRDMKEFLILTTFEAGNRFVIHSNIKAFNDPDWDRTDDREWIYEKTPPGEQPKGGPEQMTVYTDAGKGGGHTDKRHKGEVTFLYRLP